MTWEPDIQGAIAAFTQTSIYPGLTVWGDMDRAERQAYIDNFQACGNSELWNSPETQEQAASNVLDCLENLGFVTRGPDGAITSYLGAIAKIIKDYQLIPEAWWDGDPTFDWDAWHIAHPEVD